MLRKTERSSPHTQPTYRGTREGVLMPTYDYQALERELRQAIALVERNLPVDRAQDTLDFLDHAEYGLAFETLLGNLVEFNVSLSPELCALLKSSAHRMGYGHGITVQNDEVRAALELVWDACSECADHG